MSEIIKHGKLTHKEFEEYSMPFALDLLSVFSLMQEDIFNLLDKSKKEHWTPDVLLKKIEEII